MHRAFRVLARQPNIAHDLNSTMDDLACGYIAFRNPQRQSSWHIPRLHITRIHRDEKLSTTLVIYFEASILTANLCTSRSYHTYHMALVLFTIVLRWLLPRKGNARLHDIDDERGSHNGNPVRVMKMVSAKVIVSETGWKPRKQWTGTWREEGVKI